MLVTELMEAGDLWHAFVQYQESGALKWYRRYATGLWMGHNQLHELCLVLCPSSEVDKYKLLPVSLTTFASLSSSAIQELNCSCFRCHAIFYLDIFAMLFIKRLVRTRS